MCQDCQSELPVLQNPCLGCGRPLPLPGRRCGTCLRNPPPYKRLRVGFAYEEPLKTLVLSMKFSHAWGFGKLLGQLFLQHLPSDLELPRATCFVPVPLHPRRLRERGFNQALEIARPIARRFDRPLLPHACQRRKPTPPQTLQNLRQRRQNLRSAFDCANLSAYQKIILIDDVFTTGQRSAPLPKPFVPSGSPSAPTPTSKPAQTLNQTSRFGAY